MDEGNAQDPEVEANIKSSMGVCALQTPNRTVAFVILPVELIPIISYWTALQYLAKEKCNSEKTQAPCCDKNY